MARPEKVTGSRPRKVDRLLAPIAQFMAIESASGVLLIVAALIALVLANSPWSNSFHSLWHTHLRIGIGEWELDLSLLHWINDALMVVFFFVVGLEIKREIVAGELREVRKAALPLMAALGGMLVPAAFYLTLQGTQDTGARGWGIPMATDIAFVVGFLALLGSRVPSGLKVLLLSLAIVDDIGAIVVIAIAYSETVSAISLLLAAAAVALIVACRWLGIRNLGVYTLAGAALWLAVFNTGVHPTVAGVILGLLTPTGSEERNPPLAEMSHVSNSADPHKKAAAIRNQNSDAWRSVSPLERLETMLHPWVAFGIMPLFALGNAGVELDPSAVTHPVAWSVATGLVLGKPIGILFFSWLAVRTGIAQLPSGVDWKIMLGAGCLAGIGFTMSLFIASLAFEGELLSAAKIGTLIGSAISAAAGLVLLRSFLPRSRPAQ